MKLRSYSISCQKANFFHLMKFDEIQLPTKMFFRYLQLRHAIQAQFPSEIQLQSHMVEHFLISKNVDRILSSLYLRVSLETDSQGTRLFKKWKLDVPSLTDDDWEEGIEQYIPLMKSARDRYIQLKLFHQAFYTPQRLAKIYSSYSDRCPKCNTDTGTFLHVVWSCPLIQQFWREVVQSINSIGNLAITLDPRVLLLGICDTLTTNTHKRLFIFYALFYARKAILIKWKQADPPTVGQWKTLIDNTLQAHIYEPEMPQKNLRKYGVHGLLGKHRLMLRRPRRSLLGPSITNMVNQ